MISVYVTLEQFIAKMEILEVLDIKLNSFNSRDMQDKPLINAQDILYVKGKQATNGFLLGNCC